MSLQFDAGLLQLARRADGSDDTDALRAQLELAGLVELNRIADAAELLAQQARRILNANNAAQRMPLDMVDEIKKQEAAQRVTDFLDTYEEITRDNIDVLLSASPNPTPLPSEIRTLKISDLRDLIAVDAAQRAEKQRAADRVSAYLTFLPPTGGHSVAHSVGRTGAEYHLWPEDLRLLSGDTPATREPEVLIQRLPGSLWTVDVNGDRQCSMTSSSNASHEAVSQIARHGGRGTVIYDDQDSLSARRVRADALPRCSCVWSEACDETDGKPGLIEFDPECPKHQGEVTPTEE
jgi:hypothetical protein